MVDPEGTLACLSADCWRARRDAHRARLAPYAQDRTARSARGEKHPVRDFLFEYYSYRPAHLLRWSPGFDVVLVEADPADVEWPAFERVADGTVLPAQRFPRHRLPFLRWAAHYLESIAARPPQFGCFGLHEWAMLYRTDAVRHARTPLRLSLDDIAAVVEAESLCCTHFDAFRFFTPAAVPRNRHLLSRQSTDRFDQPGCVHVTMDLYRYAYKLSPWTPGEILADAFELAWKARELDMRASPYDLRCYGLEPIRIETPAGKEAYVAAQRQLVEAARPLRQRLLHCYQRLLDRLEGAARI